MKKLSLILLLMSFVAVAQTAGPQISFDKVDHDFGKINQGEKVSVTFKFTNKGSEVLEIADVKTSCGCTSATPEKLSYAPGEAGEIPVSFDSTRFNGAITKTITVVSNDKEKPRFQLRIKGDVQAEVSINPLTLTLVNIKRTDNIERELKVTTQTMDRLEVSDVTSNLDFLKFETKRIDEKNVSIHVTFTGQDLPTETDAFRGAINFKTNAKNHADMKSSVYIRTVSPIQVSPTTVYFFSSPKGKSRETNVKLSPTTRDTMKVLEAKSDSEFIKVEIVEGNSLKVTLTENAEPGKFRSMITVKTDVPELKELKIPVRGSVI